MKNLLVLLIFLPTLVLGASQLLPELHNSYIPRAYLQGAEGADASGQIDILAPLWQDINNNLYAYGQGRYAYSKESWAKNSWSGSLGFGYRKLIANSFILGAFILGDEIQTITNHHFKQISPGFELLSKSWDFRANAYFPIGKKSWTKEGWADQFGDYSHISFSGHNQYDAWYIYHEESGPGVDAEIGRTLFDIHSVLVKGYVNGYLFNMSHHADVKGVGGRVTIQPNNYLEISLNDSYDKYNKNVFEAGLRISIYDLFAGDNNSIDNNNLTWRLFTPIERNFGELGNGDDARIAGEPNDGGQLQPIPPDDGWNSHTTPEKTNVWFFQPGILTATKASNDTGGDGTYEHPFSSEQFDQKTVNEINANAPNASLYFTKGTYAAYTAGTPYKPITLNNGQSVWGRMGENKGYQMPATGSNRPIFIGSLNLEGNTEVDSIRLENSKATTGFTKGIIANSVTNVTLNNDEIGSKSDMDKTYATDLTMDTADLTVSNSELYSYQSGSATADGQLNATGIEIKNGGTLDLTNSTISANASVNGAFNQIGNAYGIHADGLAEKININHSNLTATGVSDGADYYSGNGFGILVGTNGTTPTDISKNTITVENGSVIAATGTFRISDNWLSNNAFGIMLGNNNGTPKPLNLIDNEVTIDNSSIIVKASGENTLTGNSAGILIGNEHDHAGDIIKNNNISINNGKINTSGKVNSTESNLSGNGIGIGLGSFFSKNSVINNNTVTINNTHISAIGDTLTLASGYGNGNSYGVLIGAFIAETSIKMEGNNLNMDSSTINTESKGNDGAGDNCNGFGVAIASMDALSTASKTVNSNTIILDNIKMNITSNSSSSSDSSGNVYGIDLGGTNTASEASSDGKNEIHMKNGSTIALGTNPNSKAAYGMWINTNSNLDTFTHSSGTSLTRTDGGTNGAKVKVFGGELNW